MAATAAASSAGGTAAAADTVSRLLARLEIVENHVLQDRVAKLSPLEQAAAKTAGGFKLAEHVIPLTSMKKRIESNETGVAANASAIDGTKTLLSETATALHQELEAAIAKMATKEELRAVEKKHDDYVVKTDARLARIDSAVEALTGRVQANESHIAQLQADLVLKADQEYVEEEIQAIKDELAKINIEEIMEMVRKANERIDLMDERCDKMEDEHNDLKEAVLRWQKEMEDLQLEKQIENLRRELEEAKTGVFLKVTQRMDVMQKDSDDMKGRLAETQGLAQVNRENIEDLEDTVRAHDPNAAAPKGGGVRSLVTELQGVVDALEKKYAAFSAEQQGGNARLEETEALVVTLNAKLEEVVRSKADREAMEMALQVKADKEMVARDTERNLRAVDEALGVMNAGTQGVQQLLEAQEGVVVDLATKVQRKPDREELQQLHDQLANASLSSEAATEREEARAAKYGQNVDGGAALMTRPMKVHQCLSCGSTLKPNTANPVPALPLLPSTTDAGRPVAYVPRRAKTTGGFAAGVPGKAGAAGDSLVEVTDLSQMRSSLRSSGGSHTAGGIGLKGSLRGGGGGGRGGGNNKLPSEVVGDDGRVYQGRVGSVGSSRRSSSGQR